ncbi:MAG: UPF0175 family protein [Acidobacteriota bacterium]
MTTVQVHFETDIFSALRKAPHEVEREMRLAAAVIWYSQGLLSQGRASEVAGVSRSEFIDALSASGVSAVQETLADLDGLLGSG